MPVKTIVWANDKVRIIDQTQLPQKCVYLDIEDVPALGEAIQTLRIRGAPAIGIAGAMGAVLAAYGYLGEDPNILVHCVREAISYLKTTRPTAVNLFWALDRMTMVLDAMEGKPIPLIKDTLLREAMSIWEEDRETCRHLGKHGAKLLPDDVTILTHCNAGGLATADYGTALGVIYAAAEMRKKIKVYVDETRPLLQGSRLTAWELKESGIDVTVICDSVAGSLMNQGIIDCVIVGADRIAANGDTANKIGTYTLSVLALKHDVPFYVAAPISTFDFSLASGDKIPIEERSGSEVIEGFGVKTGPEGVDVYNPAFDVTPHDLISAFITEKGVHRPPYGESLKPLHRE